MLQVREVRFHQANGLVVLLICGPLAGALVAFCWQQCFFFTHVFYTLHKPRADKLVQ